MTMFRKNFRRTRRSPLRTLRRRTGELMSFRLCRDAIVVNGDNGIPLNICNTPLIDMVEIASGNDGSIATGGFKGFTAGMGKLWYGLAINNNLNGSGLATIDDLVEVTVAIAKVAITPNTFAPAVPLHFPILTKTQTGGLTAIDDQTDGCEILWEAKHYLRLFDTSISTGMDIPNPFTTAGTMSLDGSRTGEPIRVKGKRFVDQNHALFLITEIVDGIAHSGSGQRNYTISRSFEWRFMLRTLFGGGRASPGI